MKNMKFLTLLFFLSTCFILQAQDVIEVSIQGISDGTRNSKRRDRDEAIMDAKLSAVEKAGVNIKFVTEVEDFMLKKDWIQSKAEAYLMPDFKIIDVGYGPDGLYHIVLTGEVRTVTAKSSFETVEIGSQVWMVKNLNVSTFRNGDRIPVAYTNEEWIQAGKKCKPAWCYYDNDPENGKKYGKLYNWYAVNDPRGLALKGWHVPSDGEWQRLIDYLGGDKYAGAKLKSSYDWENNGNGSNSSGFSALPCGCRGYYGGFVDMGYSANFWSSTEGSSLASWSRGLACSSSDVGRGGYDKRHGFSIRLVRD